MKIEILGSGCPNCKRLEENVRKACRGQGIDADIVKVSDFRKIASYGVMSTPAIVVDGEVLVYGRVPDVAEIKRMLKGRG
ncbi:MAG: thioredoxin family protein [Candidatus Micrarchaeota archaeon]